MKFMFGFFGVIAWLLAGLIFVTAFTGGRHLLEHPDSTI